VFFFKCPTITITYKVGDKNACSEKFKGIDDNSRHGKVMAQNGIFEHLKTNSALVSEEFSCKQLCSKKHKIEEWADDRTNSHIVNDHMII